MLANSLVAGGVAAAYVVVLILQLNPSLPLDNLASWRLLAVVWSGYGVNLSTLFYMLIVGQQVLVAEPQSPGWFSVRLLAPLCSGAAVAGSALAWLNLSSLRNALDPAGLRRMTGGALVLTTCAAAFAVLAILRVSLGRRGGRAGGLAVVLLILASLALPIAVRGRGHQGPLESRRLDLGAIPPAPPATTRVILLGLDGASLDIISPAAADGRLPNFGRLLDGGAALHLATLRPTQPGPVWTAIATGKLPFRNGVRSAATYSTVPAGPTIDLLPDFCFAHGLVRAGLLSEATQTSAAVSAEPLWMVLGSLGLPSIVVRWPLTWPARPMVGAMVTDEFHRASELSVAVDEPGLTYPTSLLPALRAEAAALPPAAAPRGEYPGAVPLSIDRLYMAVADALDARGPATFESVRLQGLDFVGHYFLRQALPSAFGDVSEEEERLYGHVLEQYYRYVDSEIGRLLDRLGPHDLLLVVSPFGMEPLSPAKRLLEHSLGNTTFSGSHERAPDGFLLAYGGPVQPGRLPRGSVVDVTPTILYFLGLPVGRDMDGYARTDLFAPDFTEDRPIVYIPTYDR